MLPPTPRLFAALPAAFFTAHFTATVFAAALFATACAALILGAAPAVADAPVLTDDVKVERSAEGFTVDVKMFAPVAPSLAWAVLTDFERMAEFIPNLTHSQVLARDNETLRVRQKGVAHYGPFSHEFDSLREIHLLPPHEIQAHGIGGNLKRMDSVMQIEPDGSGTRLRYHVELVPDFWLPPRLGPSFIRHETAEQFSAMINEMLRRR